jgi:hypothetical protein
MIQITHTASPAQARDSVNLFAALRSLGFAICFAIVTTTVIAQPTLPPKSGAIAGERDRPVGPPTEYSLVEPHLSVNPRNARNLVVVAMARVSPGNQNPSCVVSATFDGGALWESTDLRIPGVSGCADPWTAFLSDGSALLSYLSGGGTAIVILRSPDGGRTWVDPPAILLGPHDHPMLLVDTRDDSVYVVSGLSVRSPKNQRRSAIFVASSTDGARTFSERMRIVISNLSYEALTPVWLSDGKLAIGAIDHHDSSDRSLQRRRAWLLVVSGATSSEPLLITESCSRTRFVSWPSLASLPGREGAAGEILFVCEAEANGGVLLARSGDFGNQWSPATRIDAGASWVNMPAMTVTSEGMIVATWLDRRDSSLGNCWHLVATMSSDRGVTFTQPVRLSDEASCPSTARTGEGVLGRFPTGGEYHGLVSLGSNQFMAVWPDARDGHFQLRSVRFVAGIGKP